MPDGPVLVVGASRGIGAELVRQYAAEGRAVHATVRDPAAPGELADLDGNLVVHRLDVRDQLQTAELSRELASSRITVAIHNAGIYRGFPRAELMEVNAAAPIRVIQSLLDAGAILAGGVVAIMTRSWARGGGGRAVSVITEIRRRRSTTSSAAGPRPGERRAPSPSSSIRDGCRPTWEEPRQA